MTPTSDWERVRILFHEALGRPLEDRAAFLERECAGDGDLCREVESLLAAESAAGQFLETPAYRAEDDARAAPPTTLAAGDRIGDFEVLGALGSGGMGEVFRARDLKLHRDVALKLLPRPFARDPQRLARFERESRILASLSHPHIAAIHSIDQVDDLRLLVLELVEGPTLADRLGEGPLPQIEALEIARQLAEALEAAHDRGIVHRDLKPANIKTSPAGIKLLDFGLAKEHVRHASAVAPAEPAVGGTTDGLILGTCAYMSPEQARGKPVDKRTDIWAFGCVLFEMLTGRRAFAGETLSDTVAAVLERQPDWTRLPGATAPGVARLLRRCLEKDPARRLHDIADARLEIEDALLPAGAVVESRPRRDHVRTALLLLILAAGTLALGWWLRGRPDGARAERLPTYFTWSAPAGLALDSPAVISPDGRQIAFTARAGAEGPSRLFIRALHERDVRAIEGTQSAKQPFWSPDSRAIAYFARGRLMKVAIDGGAPVEICTAPDGRGGAWSRSGVILFTPMTIQAGLLRVSADGGTPVPATLLDTAHGENSHRWPAFFPDGVHFLYHARAISPERRGVYLGRVDRPAATGGEALFRSESEALYVPLDGADRGALLSVADGQIEARRFDANRNVLIGDPVRIGLPAASNTLYHAMMVSASADVLTYVADAIPFGHRFASVRRDGSDLRVRDERETQNWPRLSPDGRRIVRQRLDALPGRPALWAEDLERGIEVVITDEGVVPTWSPDGRKIAYLADVRKRPVVTIAAADGTGVLSTVACPAARCDPSDWSKDGLALLATVFDGDDQDVWLLSTTDPARSRPLLDGPFVERDARFSPDGRFVAYVSHQTGRPEVSVQAIEGTPRRDVISVGGGDQPVWRRNGGELFFVDPDGMLRSAPVRWSISGQPAFGSSAPLTVPRIGSGHWSTQYDVSPDGQRIYFLDRRLDPAPTGFGVVIGWRALLPRPD